MKCVFCDSCREYIKYGETAWKVDSIFEHEPMVVCQKCAKLYNGYPEALKRLTSAEYNEMKWFDVITSRWDNDD